MVQGRQQGNERTGRLSADAPQRLN